MTERGRARVLCVDDEQRVVEGLALHLRRDYEVHTALSGQEALATLREHDFAVVVSDMRMPGMDGAAFLHHVMHAHPDVTRLLLTGEPGRDSLVQAVNQGQVYRFLTKPCPPHELKAAVENAVIQHRLVRAERELMQETLIGCIQALVDVLAITNPVAFGRASRIKRLAMQFAATIGCESFWQLEAAAMLSQLGYMSLPVELVEKVYYGERLTPEEQVLAQGVPTVAVKLLEHIPRLEPVMQILNAMQASDQQLRALGEGTIGLAARILLLVLDYDALLAEGQTSDVAIATARSHVQRYGEDLFEKFRRYLGAAPPVAQVRRMPLRHVQPGMTIVHDLRTQLGTLLVPRGFEVSVSFLERLHNFGATILSEEVEVLVPAPKPVPRR